MNIESCPRCHRALMVEGCCVGCGYGFKPAKRKPGKLVQRKCRPTHQRYRDPATDEWLCTDCDKHKANVAAGVRERAPSWRPYKDD